MDNNDLKERDFEAYIEHWLTTEGGYVKGSQVTYDKERAIDQKTLIKCLRLTQMKKGELYEKKYGAQTEDRLYNVLQDKIHERGLIWVLRNGIDDLGFKFKLVYFEPASPLNEELNLHYQQNILECTRQFAYSTQNIFGRLATDEASPFVVATYNFFFAAVFTLIVARPFSTIDDPFDPQLLIWGLLFGLIPTTIAYLIYFAGND